MDCTPERHHCARTTNRPHTEPTSQGEEAISTLQIGVDLAKSVFQVAVSAMPGQVRERRRLTRTAFGTYFAGQAPAEVLLEGWGSAHHWGRQLQRLGHQVTLLHPRDVDRSRRGHKADRADTKAFHLAARNQALQRVPVKSREQHALAVLFGAASSWPPWRSPTIWRRLCWRVRRDRRTFAQRDPSSQQVEL